MHGRDTSTLKIPIVHVLKTDHVVLFSRSRQGNVSNLSIQGDFLITICAGASRSDNALLLFFLDAAQRRVRLPPMFQL
jgi:hypothetical protein